LTSRLSPAASLTRTTSAILTQSGEIAPPPPAAFASPSWSLTQGSSGLVLRTLTNRFFLQKLLTSGFNGKVASHVVENIIPAECTKPLVARYTELSQGLLGHTVVRSKKPKCVLERSATPH
jgi:hypothetical protein